MSRILWHGIGPWHHTGYGIETAISVPRIAALGHQVVIAVMGRATIPEVAAVYPEAREAAGQGTWHGIPVIGPGLTEFGLPAPLDIRAAFGGRDPDAVIVLKDPWVLSPDPYRRHRTAVLANVDCEPMSTPDRLFFEASRAVPVATSRWGLSCMRKAGLDRARYVPHGIEPGQWHPGDRNAARELLGLPRDVFIAGINATNIGPRKAWGEQFTAFARFHGKHPDSLLLCHTQPENPEGVNLRNLARVKGIEDCVKFGAHVRMTHDQMLSWYWSVNVVMNCTYGEGFGLPIIEAMACGIPVIASDSSAMTEKIFPGTGWLAKTQPWWNDMHQADWAIPDITGITAALGKAHRLKPQPDMIARYAQEYDADLVTAGYWKPLIEELTG